jgi:hypothetical protein
MKFTISNLTEQEVNIILGGLAELPAKHSIELIGKIKTECDEQFNAAKKEEE